MKKRRKSWDTNRTMAQKVNNRGFWCPTCDRCIVHKGQRCPVCGTRNNRHTLKPSAAA